MCRHLAYLGPPVSLAALLLDPPHGLLHQSYAPADMRGEVTANADGFGAGWYPPPEVRKLAGAGAIDAAPGLAPHGDPGAQPPGHGSRPVAVAPARYRSDRPIWSDTAFASLAAVSVGTGVVAAVRAASPGMPVTTAAAAPVAAGPWLFSPNGYRPGWPATGPRRRPARRWAGRGPAPGAAAATTRATCSPRPCSRSARRPRGRG